MPSFNAPIQGLVTNPNPFSVAPAGSLARADNVRFTGPSVLAPEPGYSALANSFGTSADRAKSVAFYNGSTIVHYGTTLASSSGGAYSAYSGSYSPQGSAPRIRMVGAARDLFINTSSGVKMISGSDPIVAAGAPRGLRMFAVNASGSSAGTWMSPNTAVAYVYTLCTLDAYDRLIEGAPSGRVILRNRIDVAIGSLTRNANVCTAFTGLATPHYLSVGDVVTLTPGEANFPAGAKTVASTPTPWSFTYAEVGANATSTVAQQFTISRGASVTVYLPGDATTNHFIRVYRSEMTSSSGIVPSDELWQVYESAFLTNADIAAGYFSFYDSTPESVLDVPLYTNANSGDGLAESNYQPPLCEDMAYWGNRLWFANTTSLQSLELSLIGVGAPDGLQNGDTVEIAGTVYTASTTPAAYPTFFLETRFDPATNIRLTAQNLVAAINGFAGNAETYAYYTSTATGFPGNILITARDLTQTTAFTAYSSRATCWNPQLSPSSATYTISSDDNRHPAGLFYSKLGQPEAVPPVNFLSVEADTEAIIRIQPLNYRLLIFKTNGIYSLSGAAPFNLTKISEARLVAPDSLALLNQSLYGLFDQGILRIDDSGPESISIAIDDLVVPFLAGSLRTTANGLAQGVGYEAGRQYLLWLPSASTDTTNTQALVYSTLSRGWTRLTQGARAAAINADGRLVVADPDSNRLLQQNAGFTDADFRGPEFTVTVVSQNQEDVVLDDASAVTAGDVILDSASTPWIVESVSTDSNTVTTVGVGTFSAGSVTVQPALACDVRFNPITGGDPATLKAWQQASVLFRDNGLRTLSLGFETEVSPVESSVELINSNWGSFEWGELPYGNPSPAIRRVDPLPLEDAQACQLSVSMQTRQANAGWELLGLSVTARSDSETNRG